MKRTVHFVVCLVFILISSVALADTWVQYNNCPCCWENPNIAGIHCTNTRTVHDSSYVYLNSDVHVYYESEENYCRSCGEYIGTGGDITVERKESHTFRNNVCTKCGYNRNTGRVEKQKDSPSQSELQTQAYLLGDKMIGGTVTAVYGGNIRQEPNEYSNRLGKIQVDETYKIYGYQVNSYNPVSVWINISYGGRDAWVSASLVQITENYGNGNSSGVITDDMVGCDVRIIVSSGRARINAGTEHPIIEYVHMDEIYRVLACKTASNGVPWYKIEINNTQCWISSEIAKYAGSGSSGSSYDIIPSDMVGHNVRIIVSSGRARSNAGTNYPIIEYVHKDEIYRILDCKKASDGSPWYKIVKDDVYCWISSELTALTTLSP